jgi:hypothetical protein
VLTPLSGTSLLKNLRTSLAWGKTQRAVAKNASAPLSPETLADWTRMRQDFDQDPTKPNPYEEPESCESSRTSATFPVLIFTVVTMKSLRRQLDQDEESESREGRTHPHTVTASTFIGSAIQIEEQQYVPPAQHRLKPLTFPFRRDMRSKEQEAIKANVVAEGLVERRKHLAKTIREFRNVQKVYMPGLLPLLDHADNDSRLDTRPELFKLMLPSQLSPDDRQSWCLPGLSVLETRFRYAQADDALAEIRQLRRLFQGLSDQNRKHINTSQGTTTRAGGTFERYKARISRFAALYRHARRALATLDPNNETVAWTSRFLELKETDIRGPDREDDDKSEGRFISSWIWLVPKVSQPLDNTIPDDSTNPNTNPSNPDTTSDLSQRAASGEEVAISIRAHWARCQARADRYEEEAELTLEEMRRTLEFFKWKSRWWLMSQDLRAKSAAPPDPQVQHGLRAYAYRQASMYSSLIPIYVDHWRKFLVEHSLGAEWLRFYPTTPPPANEPILDENADGPLEGGRGGNRDGDGDGDDDDDDDDDELDFENAADPDFEERFADLPGN